MAVKEPVKKPEYLPSQNNPASSVSGAIMAGSIIIALAILLSGGVIKIKGINQPLNSAATLASAAPSTQAAATPEPKVDMDLGHLPIKGDINAKVAVVEFADMRCPFCKRFFDQSESQLESDYVNSGKIKLSFRHFEFLGPASTTAGNAVECANEQGKFWQLHDYLYQNQPDESDTSMFNTDKLTSVATTLGVNSAQFRSCLDTTKYAKNLTDDQTAGEQAGVTGTPSFIIGKLDSSGQKISGGQLIVGAVPYTQIKAAIDQALE